MAIVVAYCHVLNAAKIYLQAVNKGPMAALFEMWPKKGLFYVIIGHVVIQKKKIIIIIKEKKKKEAGSTSWQPGFLCVCVCVFFFFSGFLLLLWYINFFFFYVKMHAVEKLDGDSCVQYALTL